MTAENYLSGTQSLCQHLHALQGQHLPQDEHKGLLIDRGFRVSFVVANEPQTAGKIPLPAVTQGHAACYRHFSCSTLNMRKP